MTHLDAVVFLAYLVCVLVLGALFGAVPGLQPSRSQARIGRSKAGSAMGEPNPKEMHSLLHGLGQQPADHVEQLLIPAFVGNLISRLDPRVSGGPLL
jgi:hypothetical protein